MLKITGIVKEIMPTEEVGSKGFAKQTLVIVDDPAAQYPSYAVFEAKRSQKKDRTLLLDQFRAGETVEVTFAPDAREWTDPKTGKKRWFGSLVLIDIARLSGAQPSSLEDQQPPAVGRLPHGGGELPQGDTLFDDDGLPV